MSGTKIRQIRELFGKTQEDMASSLNMTPQAYSRMERGETAMSIEKMEQVASVLGISIKDILSFDDKKLFVTNNTNGGDNKDTTVSFNLTIQEASNDKTIDLLQQLVGELQKEVAHLRQQNLELLQMLKNRI